MPFTDATLKAVLEDDTDLLVDLIGEEGFDINQRGRLEGGDEEMNLFEVAIGNGSNEVAFFLWAEGCQWTNKISFASYATLHHNDDLHKDFYHSIAMQFWSACLSNNLNSAQQFANEASELGFLDVACYTMSREDVVNDWLYKGQTAAHLCARLGHTQILDWLLKDALNFPKEYLSQLLSNKNTAGETPLDVARIYNQAEIVKIIESFNLNEQSLGDASQGIDIKVKKETESANTFLPSYSLTYDDTYDEVPSSDANTPIASGTNTPFNIDDLKGDTDDEYRSLIDSSIENGGFKHSL